MYQDIGMVMDRAIGNGVDRDIGMVMVPDIGMVMDRDIGNGMDRDIGVVMVLDIGTEWSEHRNGND